MKVKSALLTVHSNIGDALRGEKIAVKAQKIHIGSVQSGSSRHRIQTLSLEDSVFCIIEIPLVASRK
jgi:hypothetical protein